MALEDTQVRAGCIHQTNATVARRTARRQAAARLRRAGSWRYLPVHPLPAADRERRRGDYAGRAGSRATVSRGELSRHRRNRIGRAPWRLRLPDIADEYAVGLRHDAGVAASE